MKSSDYISLEKQYVAPNYNPLDVIITKGQGAWVWDVDGKKYLDFLAAYSALNQGYSHPKVLNAMIEQASTVSLTSRAFRNDKLPILAEKLCNLLGYEMMLPMNSGAEAVETALKAARKWGYTKKGVSPEKARIIAMENNFHGRTISIVSFSTEEDYRQGFGPFTGGFDVVPYGDFDALSKMVTDETVAVIMEPIQGESGIIVPPEGFLRKVRQLCDENRMLFIADEIQSGLGRTGKLLAVDWEEVKPDMVCLGKALGAGFYPVSAVVGSTEVLTVFKPGEHGSTFGGNPLAAAVAIAALDVIIDERLVEKALENGKYVMERLEVLKQHPMVKEVRGRGLWIGIELKPEAGGARKYCQTLMEKGVLAKDTHHHTIRLAPPLIISREDLDFGIDRLLEVLG
ncbi:MAG: ornithine--oxo-acid transaminase [Deltaproteobacteria bacterium]|nr:ornithine--oxo-acid transaminase [Deltaproteobacteria bacterium]